MPIQAKPLFRADVLRPKLDAFRPAALDKQRGTLCGGATSSNPRRSTSSRKPKSFPDFISELFQDVLGYKSPSDCPDRYTIRRENLVVVDGKRADAAIGVFNGSPKFLAVLEGKGPLDPLDRPFAGRKKSAVDQGFDYAINLKCNWILVTNLKEIRLYYKGEDKGHFEQFDTARLADDPGWPRSSCFYWAPSASSGPMVLAIFPNCSAKPRRSASKSRSNTTSNMPASASMRSTNCARPTPLGPRPPC